MRHFPVLPTVVALCVPATAYPRGRKQVTRRYIAGCPAKKTRSGAWKVRCAGWSATIRPDGSVRFADGSFRWLGLGFTFDVTDAVMRAKGQDPYAAAKVRFLDETRSWRRKLRRAWYRRQGRAFLQRLPKMLAGIMASKLSDADKRRLLFELWDECLETGSTELAAMGRIARSRILEFARRHFPARSKRAYTKEELERFNRIRTSKARFDPYGTALKMRVDSGS